MDIPNFIGIQVPGLLLVVYYCGLPVEPKSLDKTMFSEVTFLQTLGTYQENISQGLYLSGREHSFVEWRAMKMHTCLVFAQEMGKFLPQIFNTG